MNVWCNTITTHSCRLDQRHPQDQSPCSRIQYIPVRRRRDYRIRIHICAGDTDLRYSFPWHRHVNNAQRFWTAGTNATSMTNAQHVVVVIGQLKRTVHKTCGHPIPLLEVRELTASTVWIHTVGIRFFHSYCQMTNPKKWKRCRELIYTYIILLMHDKVPIVRKTDWWWFWWRDTHCVCKTAQWPSSCRDVYTLRKKLDTTS